MLGGMFARSTMNAGDVGEAPVFGVHAAGGEYLPTFMLTQSAIIVISDNRGGRRA
jgi:hypothetical protein